MSIFSLFENGKAVLRERRQGTNGKSTVYEDEELEALLDDSCQMQPKWKK